MKNLRLWTFTFLLVSPLFLLTEVATAQLKATLEGHTDNVWSVAFSPDGQMLASGSWDQTVRVWDVETEQLLHALTGHTHHVTSVAFSPDGQTLASGSWDGTIRLWNPHTAKSKRTLTEHRAGVTSVAFSPDGRILASGGADQTIRLWNTTTWRVENTLTGHTHIVESVAFSPDGDTLASGSRDETIHLWNPNTAKHIKTLTATDTVNRLAFSPTDRNTLASGSWDNTVRLWDIDASVQKQTITPDPGWIRPVAFSPDGQTLAIGGPGIFLWDMDTGQYLPALGVSGDVLSITFSPDGQTLASGSSDHLVRLSNFIREVPFENVPFDVTNIPEPVPPPPAVRDFFDLDPFYQQWINVGGFPVLASAKVSPYAVKETAWQIGQMFRHQPDILKTMAKLRRRFTLIAHNEMSTDVPELRPVLVPNFYYKVRQRGGACSCGTYFAAEEHAFSSASVTIHELAHGIHNILEQQIDSTFDNRLKALFNAVTAKGLWHGAAPNYGEYWAEGVTVWFHVPQLSPLKTREALKAYDPALATLIAEVLGEPDWRYTPIPMRTHLPHLQGFDPQSAPWEVEWPPGVVEAYEELRNPTINERSEWVNLPPYDPSLIPSLNKLRNRDREDDSPVVWADILVVNTIEAEILFYWVNPDGTETFHYRFPPNPWMIAHFEGIHPGDLLLAKDSTGSPLAVFRAVEKVGRALVAPTLHLITPGLSKVSGDNQTGMSDTVLSNPLVVEVRDETLSVRKGISVTFTVTAGNGTLSTRHTTTDENGRAESTLTLGSNRGINTVSVSVAGSAQTVTFTAVAEAAAVAIPDAKLHAAIETALGKASGAPLTTADMAMLNHLEANNANITDLTGLEHANNMTSLSLDSNAISDISPVSGLTNLTYLNLGSNAISDISPLTELTNLTRLELYSNTISNISPLAGLTNLTTLMLQHNAILNISPLAGLTNLTSLRIWNNTISDISALAGLINLTRLNLDSNAISDIPSVAELTNLTNVTLYNNLISDISPLIANTGLGEGDTVDVGANPLNFASINTHIPALQSRGVEVFSSNLKPTTSEYILSIPAGISLIHVPLRVTAVDGEAKTIESISVLYDVLHDALDGAGTVNFLITYDSQAREWRSYFVPSDKGSPADSRLGDDTGIIVGLSTYVSVHLRGDALGTNGNSAINLGQGLNVVGLPLNDSRITRVSDLFTLDEIGGNVPVIILTDGGEFKLVGRAGDPGDIAITGGQAFIMTASRAATVTISGDAWANDSGTAAAPPVALKSIEAGYTTPVLGLRGAVVDEEGGLNKPGFRVTVKNLSNGTTVTGSTRDEGIGGYQLTVVDIEAGHAATIGDTLEISAQSPNPFIGVEPLRYTVTAEDVKQSLIQLPNLVAYEIPAETELLINYPNPFNPETWIPYRLAEEAFVILTIYDAAGQVVRTLEVGYRIAAVYEDRSKAIYWDGKNELGESVASGVYFYRLSAGDYSATRRMVILK